MIEIQIKEHGNAALYATILFTSMTSKVFRSYKIITTKRVIKCVSTSWSDPEATLLSKIRH